MKVCCVRESGAARERQAVGGKPRCPFPVVRRSGCSVAMAGGAGSEAWPHLPTVSLSTYWSGSGREERVEMELGIRSQSLMTLMDVLPFWDWQILQKHVCVNRSPIRNNNG